MNQLRATFFKVQENFAFRFMNSYLAISTIKCWRNVKLFHTKMIIMCGVENLQISIAANEWDTFPSSHQIWKRFAAFKKRRRTDWILSYQFAKENTRREHMRYKVFSRLRLSTQQEVLGLVGATSRNQWDPVVSIAPRQGERVWAVSMSGTFK